MAPEAPIAWACVGFAIVSFFAIRRIRGDILDPRFAFVGAYLWLTAAPALHALYVEGAYHPGMKVDFLPLALGLALAGAIAFQLGATMAIRSRSSQLVADPPREVPVEDHRATELLRLFLLVVTTLAVLGFLIVGFRIQTAMPVLGAPKSEYYLYVSEELIGMMHRLSSITTISLIFLTVCEAYCTRDAFSWPVLLPLSVFLLACLICGERDAFLPLLVWLCVNRKRLTRWQVASVMLVACFWLGIAQHLRAGGLGISQQMANASSIGWEEWAGTMMKLSSNLHVLTNVIDAVPAVEPHWAGKSLVESAYSFVPGAGSGALTPAQWFRTIYSHQFVAGYAFSQDAEAYLNFGIVGVPLWFFAWGFVMGRFYSGSRLRHTTPLAEFLYWFFLAASLFAIRSDSRGFLKITVTGIVVAGVLWWTAKLLSPTRERRPLVQGGHG